MSTRTSEGKWSASKFVKTAVGFLALTSSMRIASARLIEPGSMLPVPDGTGLSDTLINSTVPNLPRRLTNESNEFGNEKAVHEQVTRKLLSNNCMTYVVNDCGHALRATTDYLVTPGHSEFQNRHIASGAIDHDEYYCPFGSGNAELKLWLKIEEANLGNTIQIKVDDSVVAKNNPDKTGCDIFTSVYGKIHDPGSLLPKMTVYSFT